MEYAAGIKNIHGFLKNVKTRWSIALFVIGICALSSVQIAVLLICGSVLQMFPFPLAGILFAALSAGVACYVSIKYLILPFRSVNSESCAIVLEKQNRFLNNRLINSFQLTDPRFPYNSLFSKDLIAGLINDTIQIIKKIDVTKIIPLQDCKRELKRLAFLLCVILLVNHFSPGFISHAMQTIFHPIVYLNSVKTAVKQKNPSAVLLPQAGDIELTYIYPSYTGRPPVTIKDSSGDINVLKGSEVIVSAKANMRLNSAVLRINDTVALPMEIENGNLISGKIMIVENGNYFLEITDMAGNSNPDPIKHAIAVVEDEYPEVNILFPEDMIEVKTADLLEIQYRYSDDFGVRKGELIYDVEDRMGHSIHKGRAVLPVVQEDRGNMTYEWNMALLPLKEGGKIRYYVEVMDNDSISGPKKSRSEELYLKIYDSEEGHNEVIFNQEKIFEEMLALLGDKLETPLNKGLINDPEKAFEDEKKMDEHLTDIVSMMENLLLTLDNDILADPATPLAYKKMKERLIRINREKNIQLLWLKENKEQRIDLKTVELITELWEKEIDEIETDIIEMDRLIKKERLSTLYQREDDLTDAQDSLLDLISNLSDMNSEEAMKKFEEALNRIDDLFKEFLEKMSSLSKELPDEFVNSDAFKDMNNEQVTDIMKEIRDALKKGDMERAAQLAEELISQMESMFDNLMNAAEEMTYSSMFADMEEVDKAVDAASDLLNKEKKLLEETEKTDAEMRAKAEKMWQEKIKKFKEKIKALTAILNKKLKGMQDESRDTMAVRGMVHNELSRIRNDIRSMLESLNSDIAKSASSSREIVTKLKRLSIRLRRAAASADILKEGRDPVSKTQEARAAAEAITDEFDRLMIKKDGGMDREDRRRMMKMAGRQEGIKKGTKALEEMLQGIDGADMFLGQEMHDQLSEAIKGMEKAEGGLEGGDMPSSLDGEREAVGNLSKAADGLKKFQKDLKKMMQMGGGGVRFSMRPFPQTGIGGGKKIQGKVALPSENDYKAPEEFRDEILKAMDGKSPEKYKNLNKKYYKELME